MPMMNVESCDQYDAAMALFRLLTKLGLKKVADAADVFEGEYYYDFKRKECCEQPAAECNCDRYDEYSDFDYDYDMFKDDEPSKDPSKGEPDGHESI